MDKNQVANLLDEIASLLELKEGSNPFEVTLQPPEFFDMRLT